MYTRKQVARHFNKDTETIRRWTLQFEAHLSPLANPPKRKKSSYNDDDMRVLAYVSDRVGIDEIEAIHAALAAGERGHFDDLENVSVSLSESDMGRIHDILQERDGLVKKVQSLQIEVSTQKAQADYLQSELEKARDEIVKLNRQIAVLEYRLDEDD